ncbi:MAG: TIGR02757 family protein [Methylotenera sp.]|nr:TIGR02757 family protein [Oligoflexia bacterium]
MSRLQIFLNQLHQNYHRPELLSSDPLEFVHRYDDPWDQEVVALLAAVLAYGNVKQIRRSVADALHRMSLVSTSPSQYVRELRSLDFYRIAEPEMKGFIHRFNVGEDLLLLFQLLSKSWEDHGSLGAHFLSHLEPDSLHVGSALESLISDWRSWQTSQLAHRKSNRSFSYLLTSPKEGSCCKRWCMFLRWMGRKDELDPGLWTGSSRLARTFPEGRELKAHQLIIPLDTHTGRISQYLGLTGRKSLNWLAALEVTEALKACDAQDPTRYDFAISRLGILDVCQKSFRVEICQKCDLLSVCRYSKSQNRKLKRSG